MIGGGTRIGGRGLQAGRCRVAVTAAVAALAVALSGASAAERAEAFGESFGLADTTFPGPPVTSAPAFPGPKAWWAGTCDLAASSFDVGSPVAGPRAHCIDHSADNVPGSLGQGGPTPPLAPGVESLAPAPFDDEGWGSAPSWRATAVTQAGAHPDASATFWFRRSDREWGIFNNIAPDGDPKNIIVSLPPGVVGNPNAVPKCPAGPNLHTVPVTCPPETQVGVVSLRLGKTRTFAVPIYNVEPRDGKTAEFILSAGVEDYASNIPIVARARTDGDFGVDTLALQLPAGIPLWGQTITLWGIPWAAEHDRYRVPEGYQGHSFTSSVGSGDLMGMPISGLAGGTDVAGRSQEPQPYDPSWGPIRPFFANPTECAPEAPVTVLDAEMWQAPHTRFTEDAVAPPVTGCAGVPFDSSLVLDATTDAADAATGLEAELSLPQRNDPPQAMPPTGAPPAAVDEYVEDATAHWASPAGRATAHLKDTMVTLPPGLTVNPSGAAGLEGCTDEQIGVRHQGDPPLFNDDDPFDGAGPVECPSGSIIGTAEVKSPLLEETLTGQVVLGMPKSTDPTSGEMFRTFLVIRNRERALLAKIYGSAVADPATGQLTATFANNPRLPVESVRLRLRGGDRGLFATPPRCSDSNAWSASFTPWTAAHGAGGTALPDGGSIPTSANCAFGFSPSFAAGMSSSRAGGSGTASVRFGRPDGDQTIQGLTLALPSGLLADVGAVNLCSDAQAATGACPESSRIGSIDAAAGAGSPFFVERPGSLYLTEGYKGAPYGLAVVVPVEAGPFRGPLALRDIVVRQALHVDRATAGVTGVTDPLPEVWHGIPLRLRQATVTIDRPGFMRNPTDCSPKRFGATLSSFAGATSLQTPRFQASGCAALPFKPRLALRATGRRQTTTGKHPGIVASLKQQPGEAAIRRAVVRLPSSLALDPENAQALCEFEDGTKPDLESHCPKGSIVGRARAVSPLLRRPLTGDVYFVKNVRRDARTGNLIRTLPMIVVALRGEVALNLRGESSTSKGGDLVNTFATVPDAPVSSFDLTIAGGRNGILAVTRTRRSKIDICRGKHVAKVAMDGQNGRSRDFNVRTKAPCSKRPAKRKAKKRGSAPRRAQ